MAKVVVHVPPLGLDRPKSQGGRRRPLSSAHCGQSEDDTAKNGGGGRTRRHRQQQRQTSKTCGGRQRSMTTQQPAASDGPSSSYPARGSATPSASRISHLGRRSRRSGSSAGGTPQQRAAPRTAREIAEREEEDEEADRREGGPNSTQLQCYKTKLCHFFLEQRCTRGAACSFAHSEDELRLPPDLSKTKICLKWRRGLCCRDSARCTYAHGVEELRPSANVDASLISFPHTRDASGSNMHRHETSRTRAGCDLGLGDCEKQRCAVRHTCVKLRTSEMRTQVAEEIRTEEGREEEEMSTASDSGRTVASSSSSTGGIFASTLREMEEEDDNEETMDGELGVCEQRKFRRLSRGAAELDEEEVHSQEGDGLLRSYGSSNYSSHHGIPPYHNVEFINGEGEEDGDTHNAAACAFDAPSHHASPSSAFFWILPSSSSSSSPPPTTAMTGLPAAVMPAPPHWVSNSSAPTPRSPDSRVVSSSCVPYDHRGNSAIAFVSTAVRSTPHTARGAAAEESADVAVFQGVASKEVDGVVKGQTPPPVTVDRLLLLGSRWSAEELLRAMPGHYEE